jgi:nitroreductase
MFVQRRSTRTFLDRPVAPETLESVLEAARWAPSCANTQPWLFITGTRPEERSRLMGGLMELNQRWAQHAPVLLYLFTRRTGTEGPFAGKPLGHGDFDAGAAWMSMALQAQRLGLSAHAMGGVLPDRMLEIAGIDPAEYRPLVAIALGYPASPDSLPEDQRAREQPTPRRPLREVARPLDPSPPRGATTPDPVPLGTS